MADQGRRRRNAARIIAPLALLAVAGVTSAWSRASPARARATTATRGAPASRRAPRPRPAKARVARRRGARFYRVKLNDTLGLISEKTGVSVERLQELNPELDPQNLIVGQRVKLRE